MNDFFFYGGKGAGNQHIHSPEKTLDFISNSLAITLLRNIVGNTKGHRVADTDLTAPGISVLAIRSMIQNYVRHKRTADTP